MALADFNAYTSKLAAPEQLIGYVKQFDTFANSGTARWFSQWTASPGAGVAPSGAATTCNRSTAGALGQTNPATELRAAIANMHLDSSNVTSSQGFLMLCDRLCHKGGLDATVITAQTVNTPAVPRYTPSTDRLRAAIEIYTAAGATQTTLTASYTSDGAVAGMTSQPIVFGNTTIAGNQRMFLPISLAGGDKGVSSVESVTLLATTGTAGNFGVVIYKPLLLVPFVTGEDANIYDPLTRLGGLMPLIQTDACLFWVLCLPPSSACTYVASARLAFFED
jgi:hypothetical protein